MAPITARRLALVQLPWLLAACASSGPPAGTATPPRGASAPPPAPQAAALAAEQKWLRSWFDGTPVRIDQQGDGSLLVEVPRDFCFDPGRSRVKPPLAAVLAKVAESLRRQPQSVLALVSAPDEPRAGRALAAERATQVRRMLSERGVPLGQLGRESTVGGDALRLHIAMRAPPPAG
jgi:outer membrane protein OmpA-like peptidoglycan-associated protein